MTPRGRTNQLIYQAELLIEASVGDDEHTAARYMAREEGALALTELALNACLREITEHARLARHDWRELLRESESGIAELERLRELATRPRSWLALLIARLDALHGVDGAARQGSGGAGLIATAGHQPLADELRWCLGEFKALLSELRETSSEW